MKSFTLPTILRAPIVAIIGEDCTQSLIEALNFSDSQCIKYSVSKVLGLGIVVGGSIVKLPQVMLIVNSRSARGLSLPAYGLELISYGINLTYSWRNGFPFSTFGETFFLTIQNIIITLLIIHYKPPSATHKYTSNTPQVALASAAILTSSVGLLLLPSHTLVNLQTLTIPLSAISKFPQIASNYSARSTGQLSAFAVIANILGCLARVFTTLTEVQDQLVLWGFLIASVLNIVIGVQMWMYWGNDGASVRGNEKSDEYSLSPTTTATSPYSRAPTHTASFPLPGIQRTVSPSPRTASPAPSSRKWSRKID